MHENEPVGGTHFHLNGFARRLVLTHRQKATWNWPIRKRDKTKYCLGGRMENICQDAQVSRQFFRSFLLGEFGQISGYFLFHDYFLIVPFRYARLCVYFAKWRKVVPDKPVHLTEFLRG